MKKQCKVMWVAVLSVLSMSAWGAGAQQEATTALAHAQMAVQASSLAVSQVHLHHVINCLVGTAGAAFDDSVGNPCAGQGHGALADATPPKQAALRQALLDASHGVTASTLAQAQADARQVVTVLQAEAAKK